MEQKITISEKEIFNKIKKKCFTRIIILKSAIFIFDELIILLKEYSLNLKRAEHSRKLLYEHLLHGLCCGNEKRIDLSWEFILNNCEYANPQWFSPRKRNFLINWIMEQIDLYKIEKYNILLTVNKFSVKVHKVVTSCSETTRMKKRFVSVVSCLFDDLDISLPEKRYYEFLKNIEKYIDKHGE